MNPPIAIATITMARTDAEAAELSAALESLRNYDLPVFVADRSPHAGFRASLADKKLTVLTGATGLVSQALLALKAAAANAPTILYTEPDKLFFFEKRLALFLNAPRDPAVDLPQRSNESFRTYSHIQQRVEIAVNTLASVMLETPGDYTYGPILFPSSLVAYLYKFPAHLGWGWRLFLLREAHRRGIPIRLNKMDLPCPPNQNADSPQEWLHRMRQHNQNISALLHEATAAEIGRVAQLVPSLGA
jgi:hypothetical protein